MDKSHLIDTVYTPIFKEIEAKGVFRTEKQKQRWWDLVNSGLNHTVREFSQLKNSQILA